MALAAVILLHLGVFMLLLRPILVPVAPPGRSSHPLRRAATSSARAGSGKAGHARTRSRRSAAGPARKAQAGRGAPATSSLTARTLTRRPGAFHRH